MPFSFTEQAAVTRFPNDGTWDRLNLQPSFRLSTTAAGPRIRLEWHGSADKLLELQQSDPALQPGSIALPSSCGISSAGSEKIILESTDLSGEEGATATLVAEYRKRNKRETDEDVAAGLQSRDIGARWIERQELLEHFLARRQTKGDEGTFNGALFALWLQEADPSAKIAFRVTRGMDDAVDLDNSDEGFGWAGSPLTKAAAQRFAMGIQYASQRMMQVEVNETWREPPEIDAKCNVIVQGWIPEKHRPLYKVAHFDGKMTWMRAADGATPIRGSLFRRTVVYLGVPNSMRPADPPLLWGDGPIDHLLYETVDQEGSPVA